MGKDCDLQSTKCCLCRAVYYTRCAVFPTPHFCFTRVMACACDRTPNIISTVKDKNTELFCNILVLFETGIANTISFCN